MISDLTQAPATDPTTLYQIRDGLYANDLFIAALTGLDLFTWIDAHPGSVDDIARHFGFEVRPVDVMTTLFVAMALLERDGDRLRVTELAREHLVRSSRWFLGPYFPNVADRPIARDLLDVLRTGQPASFAGREGAGDWHHAMEAEAVAEEFTAAMDRRGLILAQALAKQVDLDSRHSLLDIGGGSGIYACSLAAHFPQLRATVLEKPPVDGIAARAIEQRGFADRIGVTAADMLNDPMPRGHDVHLFSNVLHDWGEDIVRQLLRASAAALPAGGLLIVHEAFLNVNKTGPFSIAAYSVLLMHVSQGRCYSVAEMESWMMDAGFGRPQWVPTALERSAALARKS
jgi:predicted O-methyltransferase YrrM